MPDQMQYFFSIYDFLHTHLGNSVLYTLFLGINFPKLHLTVSMDQ